MAREAADLRKENAALRAENASMRDGMRRCVTCEYRLDFKQRQDNSAPANNPPTYKEDH